MSAISNIPFIAKLLLPLLAIISLWALSGEQEQQLSQQNSDLNSASDYAMTNFTLTVIDQNGLPSRIIKGNEMAHYPQDDRTDIIFPIAQFIEKGRDTWVVTANKGTTTGKGDDILLTGQVVITQPDNPQIELHTEKLTLDTLQNTAYTDVAVSMKSPHGWTDAIGLHSSMSEKTINLHSRVKGRYDAPPTE